MLLCMSRAKTQDIGLFNEADLSGIQPSGSPWIVSNDDPATVPVPLQTVIVDVQGPYTERDRKLWVFLLHAVFDELGETPMHELSVREINEVFRRLGGDHNTRWLWDSVKRLARTTVEWQTLGDDRFEVEEEGIATLLFASLSKNARSQGRLRFGFPPNLIPIIQAPRRFARLRLHFLMSLSGKYAVTLYEILEGFANRRDGTCQVTLDDLRTWLKVPEGAYPDWKNFRHRVLRPALEQINSDPIGSGFTVDYTPVRKGRTYHEIIFKMTKTDKRRIAEKIIKDNAGDANKIAAAKAKGRPALLDADINRAAQETRYELDMGEVERQFWAHWESTGKPHFTNGVAKAFMGFAKKKYGQTKGRR